MLAGIPRNLTMDLPAYLASKYVNATHGNESVVPTHILSMERKEYRRRGSVEPAR